MVPTKLREHVISGQKLSLNRGIEYVSSASNKFVKLYNGCKTPENKFGYFPMLFNLSTKFKQVTVEGQLYPLQEKGLRQPCPR